jgi:hypothetical protein
MLIHCKRMQQEVVVAYTEVLFCQYLVYTEKQKSKTLVRIIDVLAENRTEVLPNATPERYL